jgi:DNA-binding transcriptional LysR family regulator
VGQQIAERARAVTDEYERFLAWAEQLRNTDVVRVASIPAAIPIVDAASDRWIGGHPERQLLLQDVSDQHRRDGGSALMEQVRTWKIDLAIVAGEPETQRGLRSERLYLSSIRVLGGTDQGFAGRSTVELSELISSSGLPIFASPMGHTSRDRIEATARSAGLQLDVGFSSDSVDALLDRAEAGRGVALVPSDALPVQRITRSGALLPTLVVDGAPIVSQVSAYCRNVDVDGAEPVQGFWEELLEAASDLRLD